MAKETQEVLRSSDKKRLTENRDSDSDSVARLPFALRSQYEEGDTRAHFEHTIIVTTITIMSHQLIQEIERLRYCLETGILVCQFEPFILETGILMFYSLSASLLASAWIISQGWW